MQIISQADLLGDQREDGLLRFSFASPHPPCQVEGHPPFHLPSCNLESSTKHAAWNPLGAIRRKVCAHTQSHMHMPKLRGTLPPHPPPNAQMDQRLTDRDTRRDTQILIHRHVCAYMCQSWKTHRLLIQTGSKAHKHGLTQAQAGRHINPD